MEWMDSIVSTKWLAEHMDQEQVRIVDCRFQLGAPNVGREAYEQGHIPKAIYFDLEQDLSAPKGEHGGRHPLPELSTLATKLGKAGIGNHHWIIAYDDQGGMFASRFWWLLKYMGHSHVAILDGGYSKWVHEGRPITTEVPKFEETSFIPNVQPQRLVDMETVKQNIGKSDVLIIDSRDHKRYTGEEETIDPVAGHIPSAVNYFWKGVLNADGQWKTVEELKRHFSHIPQDQQLIVYCGSGVTACPNVLALERAGYKNVKLYAGSWSDWISYTENPISKGEE